MTARWKQEVKFIFSLFAQSYPKIKYKTQLLNIILVGEPSFWNLDQINRISNVIPTDICTLSRWTDMDAVCETTLSLI